MAVALVFAFAVAVALVAAADLWTRPQRIHIGIANTFVKCAGHWTFVVTPRTGGTALRLEISAPPGSSVHRVEIGQDVRLSVPASTEILSGKSTFGDIVAGARVEPGVEVKISGHSPEAGAVGITFIWRGRP